MTEDNQIAIAKAIATIAHLGQTDKAGNPYIDHPRRVAQILTTQNRTPNVIAAGWIHDVLEDTTITAEDLKASGLEWPVISYAQTVSRRDGETPEDYYDRIVNGPVGAFYVKAADIRDNTDTNRLALLDDATIARLTRKYAKARLLLGIAEETR